MRLSDNKEYWTRSAFQLAYLIILAAAVLQMVGALVSDNTIISEQTNRLVDKLGDDGAWLPAFLMQLPDFVMKSFMALFCVHLVRIYITLELMEDMEDCAEKARGQWYKGFYDSFSRKGRFVDLVLRAAIVGVVSLKVVQVHSFPDLATFLLIFYSMISLWSINAWLSGKKSWRDNFAWSSGSGFVFAVLFVALNHAPTNQQWVWQLLTVLALVAGGALLWNLGKFGVQRGLDLIRIYTWKLTAPW